MEILIYILAWVALSLVGIGALVARDNLKYKLDDAHKRIDKIFYAGLILSGSLISVLVVIGLKVFTP